MILNTIKSFLLNKYLKKQLRNVKNETLDCFVQKVGVIVDAKHFSETNALKQEIIGNGIEEANIEIIVYDAIVKDKMFCLKSKFSLKDLNLKYQFEHQKINEFISEEFDLLISYYDQEDPFLLLLTNNSKAKFKVGFSIVDKRLNHLSVNIKLENYKGFTHEVFRYLKILNKI